MFFQAILFDNLLQLQLSFINETLKLSSTFMILSIFEYIFRNYFIGLFIPLYLFTRKQEISIIKYFSWIFILISGSTNILDQFFYYNFNIYTYQLIFLFWSFMSILYMFGLRIDTEQEYTDNIEQEYININDISDIDSEISYIDSSETVDSEICSTNTEDILLTDENNDNGDYGDDGDSTPDNDSTTDEEELIHDSDEYNFIQEEELIHNDTKDKKNV